MQVVWDWWSAKQYKYLESYSIESKMYEAKFNF